MSVAVITQTMDARSHLRSVVYPHCHHGLIGTVIILVQIVIHEMPLADHVLLLLHHLELNLMWLPDVYIQTFLDIQKRILILIEMYKIVYILIIPWVFHPPMVQTVVFHYHVKRLFHLPMEQTVVFHQPVIGKVHFHLLTPETMLFVPLLVLEMIRKIPKLRRNLCMKTCHRCVGFLIKQFHSVIYFEHINFNID